MGSGLNLILLSDFDSHLPSTEPKDFRLKLHIEPGNMAETTSPSGV